MYFRRFGAKNKNEKYDHGDTVGICKQDNLDDKDKIIRFLEILKAVGPDNNKYVILRKKNGMVVRKSVRVVKMVIY